MKSSILFNHVATKGAVINDFVKNKIRTHCTTTIVNFVTVGVESIRIDQGAIAGQTTIKYKELQTHA